MVFNVSLDELSDKDRSLLVLFELEGMSGEQIAELLELKISAVWVRLHRARARFLAVMQRRLPTGALQKAEGRT